MIPQARLHIGLHRSNQRPLEGVADINVVRGGPEQLLGWLESQLGLNGPHVPFTDRVVDFLRKLHTVPNPVYARSLKQDAWATAAELLQRRDALLLAGWNPSLSQQLPDLVKDLARAESSSHPIRPGLPERVALVRNALAVGQRLPPHRVQLDEPAAVWPQAWHDILSQLHITPSEKRPKLQILPGALHLEARSQHAAVQALAAYLDSLGEKRTRTAVVCGDAVVGHMLDAALASRGLPAMGAHVDGRSQPAFQVLPLALQLCWKPVNPYALLDFLVLPISPIPRRAAFTLARALAQEPGFGSDAWTKAWNNLIDPTVDEDGKTAERLDAWFNLDRVPHGQPLPTSMVRSVCARVAQWAAGRAQLLLDSNPADPVAASLQAAAAQAKAVGDLASTFGFEIAANQVQRLVDEVSNSQAIVTPHPPQAGGGLLVASLADVAEGIETIVWFGTAATPLPQSRWTPGEQNALRAAGIHVNDIAREAASWLDASARGLARAKDLLVLRYPQGEGAASHPLWLQLASYLPKKGVVEDLVAAGGGPAWLKGTVVQPAPVPTAPAHIVVPAAAFSAQEYDSATSLEVQMACPTRWVLEYAASLEPSPIADIPADHRLKGNVAHKLFEIVFGQGPLPSPAEAAKRMQAVFDDVLDRNAAPLAQPRKLREKQQLQAELVRAAELFAEALGRGGYRIVAIEHRFDTQLDGRRVVGRIDCLVENDRGEAVIDFKHSGSRKYPEKLRAGRAVQLALYGAARAAEANRPLSAVAYYILQDSMLATPGDGALDGAQPHEIVPGDAAHDTWQKFAEGLAIANDWLTTGRVPARPMQPRALWPLGAALVIEETRDPVGPECCKYCNFRIVCGRDVVQ